VSLKEVFKAISGFFKHERLDYAVIGAFALYGYGYVRATRDIDFITRAQHQKKIKQFLESLGFETVHCSDSFSNHQHPIGATRVDIMYVDGMTADEFFSSTEEKLIFNDVVVPVPSAENLIALKLFAAQNNPDRKFKELSDIREVLNRSKVNENTIRKYFVKYGQEEYYDEIVNRRRRNT
jgi:predicted nucleotidyltransferase